VAGALPGNLSEAGDAAGGGPEPETTGNPRVDAALEPLRGLDELPVEDHPVVYGDVHRDLHEVLSRPDEDGEPAVAPSAGSADEAG
jgi:hypothetical protein